MKFLVTAGATREYIDPVRFISNPSSGKMGFSVAESAQMKGHETVLVMGHCALKAPEGIPLVMAGTADEMLAAVKKYLDWADVLVMTAAVGDWQVENAKSHKIKKDKKTLTIKFTRTPDILAKAGKINKTRKKKIFLVGFSVDTESMIENAQKKLKEKNLDLIIANPLETFSHDAVEGAVIIDKKGNITKVPLTTKKHFAKQLVKMIEGFVGK